MFTGLIQAVGRVQRAQQRDFGLRFVVDPGDWNHRPEPGESIAVNGCCLTVIEPERRDDGDRPTDLVFDAIGETLVRTTLGRLAEGQRVNLEHAARADTLLGGHIVQGHVDGLGRIEKVQSDPHDWRLRISAPDPLMECIAPKGSVTVQGVSLTIASVDRPSQGRPAWFEVALIPTTLDLTNLADLKPGDSVNLESDIIARQVVHWMRHYATPNR
ncbi:MAG: riboflavin synthase [Phycisphaerales bacterium]